MIHSTSSGHISVTGFSVIFGFAASPVFQTNPPTPTLHASFAGTTRYSSVVPAAVQPNDNRISAGQLVNGVLTVRLEAREGVWYPEGPAAPGVPVYAFSTGHGALKIPGPIIRVPAGTEIHAIVSNSLVKLMTLRGLQDHGASALDTFDIAAGATREIRFRATYRARTTTGRVPREAGSCSARSWTPNWLARWSSIRPA